MTIVKNTLWWLWLPVLLIVIWWFASANSTNLFLSLIHI